MFIKRQFAIFVMITIGIMTLAGHFINNDSLREFVDKDATQWYMIIAGFAAFLGCLNLLQLHTRKVAYKKDNWQYSIFTLLGFFIMIIFGFFINGSESEFGPHLKFEGSYFYWVYNYIYLPLASTMFALLAFFVASASYRAFRIRNFEATLLLISGVLLMLGRVPIGTVIPWWVVSIMYVSCIFALIANKIRNLVLQDNCKDTGCSLKVFDKKLFLSFPPFKGMHRFLPALFKGYEKKTYFIEVDHRQRFYGNSNYDTFERLISGIIDIVRVLIIIKKYKKQND